MGYHRILDCGDTSPKAPQVTIGDNGNWFIDGVDTGKPSRGTAGDNGDTGPKGDTGANGVSPTIKVATDGNTHTITITDGDGSTTTAIVRDGAKGDKGDAADTPAGLDCAAIDALPKKAWKKGTTVLAKQDGECIQLVPESSLISDLILGLSVDKPSSYVGDEAIVTLIASNLGDGNVETADLELQIPEVSGITIARKSFEADKVTVKEKTDGTGYTLTNMQAGGTVKVTLALTLNESGDYPIGGLITTESPFEVNKTNNRASVVLKAKDKAQNKDACDLIPIVDKATGMQLLSATIPDNGVVEVSRNGSGRINYYMTKDTLQGLTLKVTGAVSATMYAMTNLAFDTTTKTQLMDGKNNPLGAYPTDIVSKETGNKIRFSYYYGSNRLLSGNASKAPAGSAALSEFTNFTFVNGELTINEDIKGAIIMVKPQGNNCGWQAACIFASYETAVPCTNDLTTKKTEFQASASALLGEVSENTQVVDTKGANTLLYGITEGGDFIDSALRFVRKMKVLEVPAGTRFTKTITSTCAEFTQDLQGDIAAETSNEGKTVTITVSETARTGSELIVGNIRVRVV